MKKQLFYLFALLQLTLLNAQNHKAIDTADYAERKAFVKEFKTKNDNHVKKIKERFPGKRGKELAKSHTRFQEFFIKEIEDKNYTFKSEFEQYVQDIITELRQKNTEIPNDLKVLIGKTNIPNAYCLPDGTFVINMGLFNWMDNRDQIASVIAHELGHKILEHSLKKQLDNIITNEKNKTEVSLLNEVKYNRTIKAFDVFKKQIYAKGEISRKFETESDSLGYILYRKSTFKKADFTNALKNLEKYDTISSKEVNIATYKKFFSIPEQDFKEKWFQGEDFSAYNYDHYKEKINKDSVSTHPEIVERIAFLKKQFKELDSDEKAEEADAGFKKMQDIARMEMLPNLFYEEKFGEGIYLCLQSLQEEKDNLHYKLWLGKCFEKIYEGRKNYKLNHYLDRIEPKKQSKSYQTFLGFMWNLNLEEIKKIADYYSKNS
ncbi:MULTISPECIES: M48 family metalloprotease [unclassified Flavobacterium]|uniref:M48 family metalloprotease n=1 Tax=unclassified Flavobacterium TaxID=196869 RepID=UPI003623703C